MVGFLAILFFSVTGITLNHPTWFGGEEGASSTEKGRLPTEWVSNDLPRLDQLKIAEKLRADHRLRGMVKEFRQDEEECVLAFKGPGYSADVFVSRKDGSYEISLVQHGLIGRWNDLHKGRDSGWFWSIVIDLSALLMIVSSLTGLAMLFFLKRKLRSGLVSAFVGALLFLLAYYFLVP